MFRRDLLTFVRAAPDASGGLNFIHGTEIDGLITAGRARSPETGETFRIGKGYLDLLGNRTGADSIANLTNFLPGAGRGYEPLWRRRSLSLLTGETFTNQREIYVISQLVNLDRGGLYLDLGCSAGLYTRELSLELAQNGDVIGIDISPSMLKEASRRAKSVGAKPSFARADAENLPFADGSFAGAVCGGSLNEFGDPARVLGETHRVLRPGGRLAIMGILKAGSSSGRNLQLFLSTGGVRFFEPDELERLLNRAGFETEPLLTYGPVFFAGATKLATNGSAPSHS